MDHVAHIQPGQINGDMIRNVACQHVQVHLGAHHRKRSATLQTRRRFMVDEGHVDEKIDAACAAQAHEIDMRWAVLDDIALNAAADDAHVVLAGDFQVKQCRQETALLQALEKRIVVDVDRDGILTATINDSGYVALTTS